MSVLESKENRTMFLGLTKNCIMENNTKKKKGFTLKAEQINRETERDCHFQ